jgi:hypothetical protein
MLQAPAGSKAGLVKARTGMALSIMGAMAMGAPILIKSLRFILNAIRLDEMSENTPGRVPG